MNVWRRVLVAIRVIWGGWSAQSTINVNSIHYQQQEAFNLVVFQLAINYFSASVQIDAHLIQDQLL